MCQDANDRLIPARYYSRPIWGNNDRSLINFIRPQRWIWIRTNVLQPRQNWGNMYRVRSQSNVKKIIANDAWIEQLEIFHTSRARKSSIIRARYSSESKRIGWVRDERERQHGSIQCVRFIDVWKFTFLLNVMMMLLLPTHTRTREMENSKKWWKVQRTKWNLSHYATKLLE